MRIFPKSCSSKFILIILIVILIYFIFGRIIFKSLYEILYSDDQLTGSYDAVVLECWLKPQSTMIKIADSLYRKAIVKNIYISHFKPNSNKFYTGGEVPKFIGEIINLYVLEFSKDTSIFQKIPIEPKDPITLNLAYQVLEYLSSKKYKRVIILSESYHSQRTRLAFKKVSEKFKIETTTLPVEMGITKENWWNTDIGLSTVFSETLKLIYYKVFVF